MTSPQASKTALLHLYSHVYVSGQQLGLACSQLVLVKQTSYGDLTPWERIISRGSKNKKPQGIHLLAECKTTNAENKGGNPDCELQRDSAVSHPPSLKGCSEKEGLSVMTQAQTKVRD